jgi:hypothetical protein
LIGLMMDQRLTSHWKNDIAFRRDAQWHTATSWRDISIPYSRGIATWPLGILAIWPH